MALGGSCHLPMSFLLCRPGGKVSLDQLRLQRANRPVRFSPNQEPEPFGRGLPCQSDQQWPHVLRAAGDDAISTPRLHAASSRTRAAMRAMLGRVFLSVVDDRVLAKVLGPAPRSANCRGALPTSSRL